MSIILNDDLGRLTVQQWIDNSPEQDNMKQVVKSRQPLHENKTVVFDGEDDVIEGIISNPFSTAECAIYIVASTSQDTGEVVIESFFPDGEADNARNHLQFGFVDGKPTCWYGNGTNNAMLQASAAEDNSTMAIYRFVSDGSERSFYKGDQLLASSTTNYSSTVSNVKMGEYVGSYHSFQVRALVSYEVSKTVAEQDAIREDLANKFAIDISPPNIAVPTLSLERLTTSSFKVSWTKATDDATPQNQLSYTAYYSTSNNISTIADAEANGTPIASAIDISEATADGLAEGLYYVNVVVEDKSNKKNVYSVGTVNTAEVDTTSFVSTSNGNFMLNGKIFTGGGTNAYYLHKYEAAEPADIDEFFDAAQEAGVKVVRTWGHYEGPARHSIDEPLQPEPGVYNQVAFEALDRVISKANEHGIKLIIAFTDYWTYTGGIAQYNRWAGESNPEDGRMAKFINGDQQQQWFKDYISYMLNRINTATGLAYKDDPTIFGWEIGNELQNNGNGTGVENATVLRDWYQEIAQYIKSIDSNHIISTGEQGLDVDQDNENSLYQRDEYANTFVLRSGSTSYSMNCAIPEIDYCSNHWYPDAYGFPNVYGEEVQRSQEAWVEDHVSIAADNGKPAYMGEFGWSTDGMAGIPKINCYNDLWDDIERAGMPLDMVWQFAHRSWNESDNYHGNILVPTETEGMRTLYNNYKAHCEAMLGIADTEPPTISNMNLTIDDHLNDAITVAFEQAFDNQDRDLDYELYLSQSDNITTAADAVANGTPHGSGTNIAKLTATGLSAGTLYYANVVVTDEDGNQVAYTMNSGTTNSDVTDPIISDATLGITNIGVSSFDVDFVKASDGVTAQTDLVYKLYVSQTNNITTAEDAIANGTLVDEGVDVDVLHAQNMLVNTTYYINVVVSDYAGNDAGYTSVSVTTENVVGGVLYEWSEAGVELDADGHVVSWADNVQGARMNVGEDSAPPAYDAQKKMMHSENNNQQVGAYDISIPADNFQISIVIDMSIAIEDFAPILTMGPMDSVEQDPGTMFFGTDTVRNGDDLFEFNYNGQQILPLAPHFNTPSVITIRALDGTINTRISSYFGTDETAIDDTIAEATLIVEKMVFNARMAAANIPDDYTGQTGSNIVAMRVWNDAGTLADMDARIQGMKDDFMSQFADTVDPEVTDTTLTPSNETRSSFDVSFTQATDNATPQSDITYSIYVSESDNIGTVANAENNGTFKGSVKGVGSINSGLLDAGTTYYFNIIAEDQSGNKIAYTTASTTTLANTNDDPALELNGTGIVTDANGKVSQWTDNVNGYAFVPDDPSRAVTLNGEWLSPAAAGKENLWLDNLGEFKSDDFMVAVAVDLSVYETFTNIIGMGRNSSYDPDADVGAYIRVDDIRDIGGVNVLRLNGYYNGSSHFYGFRSYENQCIVWLRYSSGTLEMGLRDGTNETLESVAVPAATIPLDVFALWSGLYDSGLIDTRDPGTTPIKAISLWGTGGDAATRDARVQDMINAHLDVDQVEPTVSDSTLTLNNATIDSFDLSFNAATDNEGDPILYSVYISESNNLDTLENTKANGILKAQDTDVTAYTISNVSSNTTYYVQVIAEDSWGNELLYTSNSIATLADSTDPTVSDGTLTPANITSSAFDVGFAKATDNASAQADLTYTLYTSQSNNLDTVANIEANGTLQSTAKDVTTLFANDLASNTLHYFNVIVEDEAGNKTAYTQNSATTDEAIVGLAHEWDDAGVVTDTDGVTITAWNDNIGGANLAVGGQAATWDSTNKIITLPDDSSDFNTDQLSIDTNDFMIALVFDMATITNYNYVMAMAAAGGERNTDGGVGMYKYEDQEIEMWVDGSSTQDDSGDIDFFQTIGICVIRSAGGTVEGIFDDGVNARQIGTIPTPSVTLLTELLAINQSIEAGSVTANAGSIGLKIKAIRLWNTGGTDTERDNRISTMLTDYVPADTTGPTLSSATGAPVSDTVASGSVSTNEANGTLYAVVTQSSTAPTIAQIKAGQDETGAAADYATTIDISSGGVQNMSATGLTASTTYYWHFMHEDALGNQSSIASSTSFTTEAASTDDPALVNEWDPSDVAVVNTNEVDTWIDGIGGAIMTQAGSGPVLYDSTNGWVSGTDDNDLLYSEGLNFLGNSCQISFAAPLSQIADGGDMINLAGDGQNDFADSGFQFNIIDGTNIEFSYGGSYIGTLTHSGKDGIVTIWYDGTTAYAFIDTFDGERYTANLAITAHTIPTTRITFNGDITVDGVGSFTGSIDAKVIAIRIWNDHVDAATRDARIDQMITDYLQ